jgi:hypothetical protein
VRIGVPDETGSAFANLSFAGLGNGGKDTMKTTVNLAAIVLIAVSLTSVAQGQNKPSCVKDITYGKEFLAKFPDAGSACQEVKVLQGEKWVRFNAQVKQNENNRITVDFLNTEQKHTGNPMTFEYTPDATLTLKNKNVKAASAVKKGDTVMVWVPESRFGLYAKPGPVESGFKLVQ